MPHPRELRILLMLMLSLVAFITGWSAHALWVVLTRTAEGPS